VTLDIAILRSAGEASYLVLCPLRLAGSLESPSSVTKASLRGECTLHPPHPPGRAIVLRCEPDNTSDPNVSPVVSFSRMVWLGQSDPTLLKKAVPHGSLSTVNAMALIELTLRVESCGRFGFGRVRAHSGFAPPRMRCWLSQGLIRYFKLSRQI
jgi:hypothetical protein